MSKIGFLNPKTDYPFLHKIDRLIRDHSDHGASKKPKNPLYNLVPRAFPAPQAGKSPGNEVVHSGKDSSVLYHGPRYPGICPLNKRKIIFGIKNLILDFPKEMHPFCFKSKQPGR